MTPKKKSMQVNINSFMKFSLGDRIVLDFYFPFYTSLYFL